MNMPEGQGRITAFWNTVAPDYEAPDNVAPVGTADYAKWVDALRSVLPASPARVLDVGTGTGFIARIAAELGHQVTAIDLSEGMLDASPARDCSITFAVGDAVDPPFPAGSFDVVVSRSLLWTLRQPELAFRNWHNSLARAGGWSPSTDCLPLPDQSRHPTQTQRIPAASRPCSNVTTRHRPGRS
jgi:SAM-dependent methyltransferase